MILMITMLIQRIHLWQGLLPFFVCASVGTTSSAAADPVLAFGAIARREALWLHVDAAYAGAAALCPEMRADFEGAFGGSRQVVWGGAVGGHLWHAISEEPTSRACSEVGVESNRGFLRGV
jgi:hypothetical protein